MIIKPIIFLIISILFVGGANAQDDTLTAKQIREIKQDMAVTQIKELKTGVLLIQLKTSQPTIDAYAKRGNEKMAIKTKMLQDTDNKSIIKGFRDYFTFCPVYFYYSTDKAHLENKLYEQVTFLDDSLGNTTIPVDLNKTNYYISGIAKDNFKNTTLQNIPNYELEYNNSIQFDAFIIQNKNFQQLSAPFPYYSKTHVATKVNDKKRWESIKKLNHRLHSFYKSSN